MRIRFEATTRRPASSSILVMPPVRLRRVASGLMIEKVRVTAMTGRSPVLVLAGIGAPPSRACLERQGSALVDPFAAFLRPIAALDSFPAREKLPGEASAFEHGRIEQIETAVVAQRSFAPLPVGDQHVAGEIGRVWTGRKEDRLARVFGAAG